MFQQSSATPDYLFFDDSSSQLFIVECKGNQSSYNSALDQLRRGTEQVPSITFNSGRISTAIVIATCMLDSETNVYIIDPSDAETNNYRKSSRFEKADQVSQATWKVADEEGFNIDSRLISRAKILNFAGAEQEALSQLPLDLQTYWSQYIREERKQVQLDTNYGKFIGSKETFVMSDGSNIQLFRGVLNDLWDNIYIPQKNEKARRKSGTERHPAPEDFTKRFKTQGFIETIDKSQSQILARSVSRDGTIFQITIDS